MVDYVDYTGRTNAVNSVAIQPRVTGFLEAMPFHEGDLVRKGDILFKIDPKPFAGQLQAAEYQLKAAQFQLEASQAKYTYDAKTNKQFQDVNKQNKQAVSELELNRYQALEDQSKANVAAAKANVATSEANLVQPKLNFEWTDVRSPIDGHVSRYFLTKGNLVEANSTQLTTVMSIDPMYVYFDMDEPTLLRIKQGRHEGKIQTRAGQAAVYIQLRGRGRFHGCQRQIPAHRLHQLHGQPGQRRHRQHPGPRPVRQPRAQQRSRTIPSYVLYASLPASFATLPTHGLPAVAAAFAPVRGGNRLLVPGMFVRVRLPIGLPQSQLLVVDRAIISEQGQKKIFVVNKQTSKVEERSVTLGPLQDDGLRVVSGKDLHPDDWIAFTLLQQLRASAWK